MSEVLTRSLATSFTVLMPVGALLLFGGETLKDFAFALLVGVASGAYSSIFIATPVVVEWKEREQVYIRRRRLVREQHGGLVPAFATGALAEPAPATAGAAAGATRTTRRSRRSAAAGTGAPRSGAPPRSAAPPAAPPPPPAAAPSAPPASEPPAPEPAAPKDGADAPARPETPAPPSGGAAAPGDGASTPPAPRESRTTSTAGGDKPKPKRQRPRKKHGRR
jgi:SecD/SecF fusion protein